MKDRITLEIAEALNISRDMARLWRNRWLALSQKDISVGERLADAERPGGPMRFSYWQILQLKANCLREARGLRATHQSLDAKRISFGGGPTRHCQEHIASTCGALDGGSRFETAPVAVLVEPPPTRSSIELVQDICDSYLSAIARAKQGERTVSIDEMTGIQALFT